MKDYSPFTRLYEPHDSAMQVCELKTDFSASILMNPQMILKQFSLMNGYKLIAR